MKQCPRCGLAAPLNAAQCVGCGHLYRTNFGQKKVPVWVWILGVGLFLCIVLALAAPLTPETSDLPSKIEMVDSVRQFTSADKLIEAYGEPDERDRNPGGKEVWTYYTYDGAVVFEIHQSGFVSDSWTL